MRKGPLAPLLRVCVPSPAVAGRNTPRRPSAIEGSLAAIAADVGYESEAAFNRAFKRVTGVTPGRWREGDTANLSDGP